MLDYVRQMFDLAFDGQKQGVIFFMVLYASVVCALSLAYLVRVRGWPSVEGVLHARGARAIGADIVLSRRDHVPWAHYEYVVGGRAYTGQRVSAWQFSGAGFAAGLPKLQTGLIPVRDGRVQVYYDPRRPQRSYVLRPGWPGMLFLLLALAVPPLLFAWHYHGT